MDDLRQQVADELWRQIVEDFRNPTLGAFPDMPGASRPQKLLLERADAVLALIEHHSTPDSTEARQAVASLVDEAERVWLAEKDNGRDLGHLSHATEKVRGLLGDVTGTVLAGTRPS